MKEYSVLMSIVDFIPVIFFAVSSVILMRDLYNKMSKGAFAIFSAGCIDIVFAGFLKALYKLLFACQICDFEPLNEMFFPVQSIGFLLAGLGVLAMISHRQTKSTAMLAAAPPVFKGTFVFVSFMVVGLGMLCASLSVMAAKLKKKPVIVLFILSFVCSLCMGYLSSRDFAEASMNWIAEGVNILGQGAFLLGVMILHKNGMQKLKLHEVER